MSRLSSRLFLAPITIQVMLRWRNHEMGDYAGHAGDFSNHIGGGILYAFGENDAADVNLAAAGFNFEVRNFQYGRR